MSKLVTYSKKLILQQSEELIIEETKNNPRRFEPLYNRYHPKIFTMVLNRVGDKEVAGDLTSNVFFKALNKIKGYNYNGFSIYTWLYRIAINECNEYFRKAGATKYIVMEIEHLTNLSDEISPFDDDVHQQLKKALTLIKSSDLELIRLRFFERLSFKEIAEVLDISEGNSKVRLYRALERLKKLMKVA
ncbi:MAG: RNA polymerase sigma factor [Bacteroidota bacterium]